MSQLIPCPKCGALCDAGNCPCLSVAKIIWAGDMPPFELAENVSVKMPTPVLAWADAMIGTGPFVVSGKLHPLLPLPYQLGILDGLDDFKTKLWKRDLKSGNAAG